MVHQGEARTRVAKWLLPLCCTFPYLAAGLAIIPYPGIQNDEVLFANSLYRPEANFLNWSWFGHVIPVMELSYLGALKTWIYAPLLKLWHPSVWSLRIPVFAIGFATILLCFRLARLLHGKRAAVMASLLLATDSIYLLTTCFDWGPVALQHLLLLMALVSFVEFHRRKSALPLWLGAFCCGLALWDKAVFVWMLAACVVSALVAFPAALKLHIRNRRIWALLLAGLLVGGLPLWIYNFSKPFHTYEKNAKVDLKQLSVKFSVLRGTLNGGLLFGYMVRNDVNGGTLRDNTALESVFVAIHDRFGQRRASLFLVALLIAFVLSPIALFSEKSRRPVAFLACAFAVGWLLMAVTKDAGGSAHHVVLLWPLPHLLVGIVFAEVSMRFGRLGFVTSSSIVALCVISNLLVTNQYLYQFARYGPGPLWTDAIFALSDRLPKNVLSTQIAIVDWGIMSPLEFLHDGDRRLVWAAEAFIAKAPSAHDLKQAEQFFADRDTVWVNHVSEVEVFPGVGRQLVSIARGFKYRKVVVGYVNDSSRRPLFELSKFEPEN